MRTALLNETYMLRTIVFDMGNVLLHFSHERMCRQIAEVCGSPATDVRRWLFDDGWELAFERGDISADEFQRRVEQRAGRTVDRNALSLAAADIFTLNEPLVPLLDGLRAAGLRLVLLSNTNEWHLDFVRQRYGVLERFDESVVSFAARAVKPEPAIFEAALKAIDCAPGEAFYTDDIPDYIAMGRQCGLQAEVFVDAEILRSQLATRGLHLP
jgi:HAD superfamily hydrolase (TIGR01509 family)